MQKLFVSTILVLIAGVCLAQKAKTVFIKGKVSGDTKGNNYIYYYAAGIPSDSVLIKNGKFVIKLTVTETMVVSLVPQYDRVVKQAYKSFYLVLDGKDDVEIEMDIEKGFFNAKLKGSRTAVEFNQFSKQRDSVYIKVASGTTKLYGKSYVSQNDPLAEKLMRTRDSFMKLYMEPMIKNFVETHRDQYIGIYILNSDGKAIMALDTLDKIFTSLPLAMKQTSDGQKLAAYIRGVRNTSIGATVKNFVLNDQYGKPVSFDQLKGKYVWIDFWASWCGPCKMAFPHMRDLYAKYKDKGLEILGISTDSKIDPWLKILPTLQNPWPQVWDNKSIKSEFAVTAYPTSFLIGPDGKILLREVGYEPNGASAMDKKLEEIFGAASATTNTSTKSVLIFFLFDQFLLKY